MRWQTHTVGNYGACAVRSQSARHKRDVTELSEPNVRSHFNRNLSLMFLFAYLSMTPPSLMALFQSFSVAFPAKFTNCLGLMSCSLNCKQNRQGNLRHVSNQ